MSQDLILIHIAILAGYTFLAHAIILIDDGLHWDGWILDSWQRTRNWAVMRRIYAEVGLSPFYYLHKVLSSVPARIFVYRFIAFGSTLASGVAVYFLSVQTGLLNEFQSLLLALLYLSYTGYHMNADTVIGVHYTLAAALFYWAVYITFLSMDHTGSAHWFLRALSLALFLSAFNANSTLVYYFGFLGFKFFLSWDPAGDVASNAYRELIGNLDYLVAPFAYWLLKNTLTPRHGHYENYNRIKLRLPNLALKLLDAIRFGVEASITTPVRSAIAHHYLWAPVLAFALAFWACFDNSAGAPLISPVAATGMVGLGSVLVILAALPYALVGQNFFPGGWTTKHHMLFHLPVSLIVLGVLACTLPAHFVLPAIAFMLTSNAIHLNLTYLHHIGVAVKNRSWLYKLSKIEGARDISVFLVTDHHSIRGDPFVPEQEHRPAYLFYMFEWLWGDKTHCGIPVKEAFHGRLPADQVSKSLAESTLDYDMGKVNVLGPQARVTISDGPLQPSSMIPLFYLRRRWLRAGKVEDVLEDVTALKYTSL